ncbi:MAG: purine-nucleoside phosphorylase [Nitrososphaerota archaeon]|jgi:5'-methylthioadenosine phosphorylase|nr:purine-nucleoside phosphorylase [Nitrososphaerota archaeon]MDG6926981.1 purine-nucleoside phosphorylase [Nitrososphaerota archaeon]MDG6930458.1 purine-nucleoside phosphorylase [Nitrososphaerota archaeon]MDG6931499.1 purine-nucleoside phosphorylase [Nitrososphaerota archaeon]MDG6936396.1 purine-nucleoside phosphorylase [Nitrososphaerota archaeon]
MPEPQHIKAKAGDIAERVLLAGDPDRVRQLSNMLQNATVVNENRGYITYTGFYREERVTIACHGIGAPSAAIVIEELHMLGAKVMIRLGTAGGLLKEMKYGDVLIANGAFLPQGNIMNQYSESVIPPTVPSYDVLSSLVNASRISKTAVYIGPVHSGDAFYAEGSDHSARLSTLGYIGAEMEAGTLFALASLRGFKAGALFMVSNNIALNTPLYDASKLRSYLDNVASIAMDALVSVKPDSSHQSS